MNIVILHGRLTDEPKLENTSSGVEYCKFTVAVNRPTGKDKEKQTDFIPCTAWRQSAAFICNYAHKGDGVCVEGRLESRKYEKDGQKRTAYDVQVNRIELAEKKGGAPNVTTADGFVPVGDDFEDPFS